MQMTGAEILVLSLIEQGVEVLFGYPGGYVIDIFDALEGYKSQLRLVLPSHEQGGIHAADGYARASGKTGVMLVTSGPGATNLTTGIAAAFMDSTPLVVITGNVPHAPINMMGRDSFQEIDILGVTLPLTKHSFLVTDGEKLSETIKLAFTIANSGRPGPVLIDIPKNVAAQKFNYKPCGKFTKRPIDPPRAKLINQAAEMLSVSSKPLLFCGGGVLASGGSNPLIKFAEKLDAPVAASLMGLTSLPRNHPLMLGMLGMHGTPAANFAGEHCDLIVASGTRFSDRVAGDRRRFAPNAKIIHIDIDESEFDKNVVCDLHIQSDAKAAFEALYSSVSAKSHENWRDLIKEHELKHLIPVNTPAKYLKAIHEAAGDDAVIITDVGQHQMWAAQSYPFCKTKSFITSGGLGAMGFGLGAAIGAKLAAPERPAVLITGDGSFHMNLAELATAAAENVPIIVVIFNNGTLGMVRQWQAMFYNERYASTTTNRKTDFPKLAEAFGVLGFRANSLGELRKCLAEGIESGKTCVIDCPISPDEKVFPFVPPGKGLSEVIYE